MVVILFLFILTVNNSSFSLIHTCYLLFWSSLQCDLEKEYELQNFLYVWIIKSSHPPNLLWYLVMVFSRFLLFAWTCRLEKSLGEHVYIAFRLGIMSKLKTKWLLSKTSAFNVGFIFKEKEHILASEMQTACLIQVNLVNSPSPCLVQRNEAFCPVWVALLVPSACDHRGVASPLQPCLLVLPQAFLTLTECSSWLPASCTGLQLPCCSQAESPCRLCCWNSVFEDKVIFYKQTFSFDGFKSYVSLLWSSSLHLGLEFNVNLHFPGDAVVLVQQGWGALPGTLYTLSPNKQWEVSLCPGSLGFALCSVGAADG